MLDGFSFLLFAALLLLVQFPTRAPRAAGETVWQTFREGLQYVRGRTLLVGLPAVSFLLNASFAPVEMLLPGKMLALGAGERGFGLFFGLLLGGMAAGSLLATALGPKLKAQAASVWGMAAVGLCLLTLALTGTALQMYVLAALLGIAIALGNFGTGVIFQRYVNPDYFGRVGSLISTVSMVGMPLTLLALAPVADRLSIQTVFASSGSLCLLGAAVWARLLNRTELGI
ncbi:MULTISPECIES: hypothetical protein [Deinococcus]|uniref:hypothetical protein n=1 Tax=Deinococcus TaxID=1298 RepID=UPI001FE00A81|nr:MULTISPECIES: hypothetical protein [Deinococcus]MCY1702321.1 hypothetical protein [Deinococcus sp. SL84]